MYGITIKKGFTLAEILITLSIIGVIASMTIPSLVQDTQEAQWKMAWKKTYADINQAVKMAASENAGSLTSYFSSGQLYYSILPKYLRVMKTGTGTFPLKDCTVKSLKGDNLRTGCCGNSIYIGGSYGSDYNDGAFILANGAAVIMDWDTIGGGLTGKLVYALVDVNGGSTPPNIIGRDIFGLAITKNRVVPFGAPITELGGIVAPNGETTCSPSTSGTACSATYLYQ